MYERSNTDSNSIYQDIKVEESKVSKNHLQDIASEMKGNPLKYLHESTKFWVWI